MTPTYETTEPFDADFDALPPALRKRFLRSVDHLVEDLSSRRGLRPGLRVKRVQGSDGAWEMTYAPDGRAVFGYGDEVIPGQTHVIWRRMPPAGQICANSD